jgi:hypothetical protein
MSASQQSRSKKLIAAILSLAILLMACLCVWMLTKKNTPDAPQAQIPAIGGFATNNDPSESSNATHCIALDKFFNAGFNTNWLFGNYNFSKLPTGLGTFCGTLFDVRSIVQLSGTGLGRNASRYPKSVEGIPVNMKCAKLHFLHATGYTMSDGSLIGAYVVHFSDGRRQEVRIVYGQDVFDWWIPEAPPANTNPAGGTNAAAWSTTIALRISGGLYKSTWVNPSPGTEVKTIDFVSLRTKCAPFLVAITAE